MRPFSDSGPDARRAPRFRCHGPIEIQFDGLRSCTGRIANLSLSGCLIQPSRWTGCLAGDHVQLRIEVNGLSVLTRCVVRWVRPGGAMGVEIIETGMRGRYRLAELIEELGAKLDDRPEQSSNE